LLGGDSVAIAVVNPRSYCRERTYPIKLKYQRTSTYRLIISTAETVDISIRVDSYQGQKAQLSADSQTNPHFRNSEVLTNMTCSAIDNSILLSRYRIKIKFC
jgi:hypothetical protein